MIARVLVAALVSALALGAVGCSASQPPRTVPSAAVFDGTREEYQRLVAECLTDDGWDITVQEAEDGSGQEILFDVGSGPDRQQRMSQYRDASVACAAELPPVPEPRTDDDIRAMYDHKLEQYECLLENGFFPGEPSSFQTYLDDFRAQGAIWDPIGSLPQDQTGLGQRACPPDPATWW